MIDSFLFTQPKKAKSIFHLYWTILRFLRNLYYFFVGIKKTEQVYVLIVMPSIRLPPGIQFFRSRLEDKPDKLTSSQWFTKIDVSLDLVYLVIT